ncbi:ABC transporter substrate-binding protein [Bacillus sp. M6-12]|uniref:ABC transporter substrate-binding protein n=1 Tax=Bacillus sp. M6-12 TaxID=2054166 RepID=UPI0015E14CB9|nr:ABC transporter substrate-binding protein [Bacillus sp. M6-12]
MRDFSYFQLRALLYQREQQQTAEFKLKELEPLWFCTQKNIKRKLNKFAEEGLLHYEPGIGRGNPSRLVFHEPFQSEVQKTVQLFVEAQELDSVIQLMHLPIPKNWFTAISKDVQSLFGLHTDESDRETLRTIMTRDITTLDPLQTSVTFECSLIQQLGDTLLVYDRDQDTVRPHLAHHWTVSADHRVWTFYLRKGVYFHHQRIMTSYDVVYTIARNQDKTLPYYWLVEDIETMECPGKYIVRLHLKKPNPFFSRYLCSANLSILPEDVPFDEFQWVGTGPFMLKARTDKKMVLEAFDRYFLERPFIDEIEFWRVSKDTVYDAKYQVAAGNEQISTVESKEVEPGFRFLSFNFNKDHIVQQPGFRQAIYHLMDVKKMLRDLGRKNLSEASSYFLSKSRQQEKHPERVAALLADSGYSGEELTLYTIASREMIAEGDWLVSEAKVHGINLRHVVFEIDQIYTPRLEAEADLVLMEEIASEDTHLSFIGFFYNRALVLRRFVDNERFAIIDSLLDEFKRASGQQEREDIIDKIEKYLGNEMIYFYTHHPIRNRTFNPLIQDIRFQLFGHADFRKLWIQPL